jgi:hypothetical protein
MQYTVERYTLLRTRQALLTRIKETQDSQAKLQEHLNMTLQVPPPFPLTFLLYTLAEFLRVLEHFKSITVFRAVTIPVASVESD